MVLGKEPDPAPPGEGVPHFYSCVVVGLCLPDAVQPGEQAVDSQWSGQGT